MRLVTFTAIIDLPKGTRTTVKINPDHVVGIQSPMGANGPLLDRSEVLVSGGSFLVVGSVDEVAAALEGVAAPVAVKSGDLERAARLAEILADGADDSDYRAVDEVAIDHAVGADGIHWSDSIAKLRALANRLRGGAP